MPKTPPLLLPTGPDFQDTQDATPFQSLLSPLPPSNYSAVRLYPLDTVIEEENETSMIEDITTDMMDDEKSSAAQTNDAFSQHDSLPTTSASVSSQNPPHYYPSTVETTFLRQPAQLTDDERAPEDRSNTSQNWNLAYDSALTKHQDFKELIESCASTLAQSDEDQQDAIQDLQNYKEHLQARGAKLHERWFQAQVHAQQFLQLPPFSDDPSNQ